MSGISHVNLTAESESYINKTVTDYAVNATKIMNNLVTAVNGVCSSSCHEELCKTSRSAIDAFDEAMKNVIKPRLNDWKDNDGFKVHVAAFGSGQQAEQRASKIDNDIVTVLTSIEASETFTMPQDTSAPSLKNEHFESLKEAFDKCSKEFNTETDAVLKNIEGKISDDRTYGCLLPAMQLVGGAFEAVTKEMVNKIKALEDKVETKSKSINSENISKKSQAKTTSATAAQSAAVNSLFEDF